MYVGVSSYDYSVAFCKFWTFCVSPIDSRRFHESLQGSSLIREDVGAFCEKNIKRQEHVPWNLVFKPKLLAKAIKQHHMCEDSFFVCVLIQFVALIYLLYKTAFHPIMTGDNQRLARYYEDKYLFPRMFQSYSNAHNFYNMAFSVCLYYFLIRLLSLIRLIKYSLINLDGYKQVTTAQMNFSYAAIGDYHAPGWWNFFKYAYKHHRQTKNYSLKSHTQLNKITCRHIDSQQLYNTNLIYQVNILDFNECYKGFDRLFGPQWRPKKYTNWHLNQPVQSADPVEWAVMAAIFTVAFNLAIYFVIISIVAALVFEVINEHDDISPILQRPWHHFCLWLSKPTRLIRFIDIVVFIFVQLPNQIDATFIYFDCGILFSRVKKLTKCFQEDLVLCLDDYKQRVHVGKHTHANHFGYSGDQNPNRHYSRLNDHLRLLVKLARFLRLEFLDLKKYHSDYINLMMMLTGFCIGSAFSLISTTSSLGGLFCLIIGALSLICPMIALICYAILLDTAVCLIFFSNSN